MVSLPLQRRINRVGQFLVVRLYLARIELDDLAGGIDEVFAEIPGGLGESGGEELVDRRLSIALFGDHFLEHREVDIILGCAEGDDLRRCARFLAAKVVGGKAEDEETLGLVVGIKFFQSGVLRSETAMRGDIYHEDDVALVLAEINRFAIERGDLEVVERTDGIGGGGHGGEKKDSGDDEAGDQGAHRLGVAEGFLGGIGKVHALAHGGQGGRILGDDHRGFESDKIDFDGGRGHTHAGDVIKVDVSGLVLNLGRYVEAHDADDARMACA